MDRDGYQNGSWLASLTIGRFGARREDPYTRSRRSWSGIDMVYMPSWLHLGFKTCTMDTRTYIPIQAYARQRFLGPFHVPLLKYRKDKRRGQERREELYVPRTVQFTRRGHSSMSMPTRSPGQHCRTSSVSAQVFRSLDGGGRDT